MLLAGPVSFSWLLGFPLCFQQFGCGGPTYGFHFIYLAWGLLSSGICKLICSVSFKKNSWSLSPHILLLLYYCFFLSDTPIINMLYRLCPMCSLFSSLSFYSCFSLCFRLDIFRFVNLVFCLVQSSI